MEDLIREAREQYKDVLNNKAVRLVSAWTEPNTADPTNELDLRERATTIIDAFFGKVGEAFNNETNSEADK